MANYRQALKNHIVSTHGSVAAWAEKNEVPTERFYNFLKGKYNPTVLTLEKWMKAAGLEISCHSKSEKIQKR